MLCRLFAGPLHLQQNSPQILVNAHHLQQLLDTLKAFQALLGCQVLHLPFPISATSAYLLSWGAPVAACAYIS